MRIFDVPGHHKDHMAILDEAVAPCDTWWKVFDQNSDRLDNSGHIMEAVFKEINPAPIYPEILSLKLKILAGVMTGAMKLLRKEPMPLYKHLMKGIIEWLGEGYRTYKAREAES